VKDKNPDLISDSIFDLICRHSSSTAENENAPDLWGVTYAQGDGISSQSWLVMSLAASTAYRI
jgi:hypothetical protein